MPEYPSIIIDPSGFFPHLPRAPIVEAVIEFRARAEQMAARNEFRQALQEALPGYPNTNDMSRGSVSVALTNPASGGDSSASRQSAEHLWIGLRVESADRLQVGMFTRDFFSFSRLKPYENWAAFRGEALRLWEVHKRLSGASEIARLGVRFINRFDVPLNSLNPGDYLKGVPAPAGKLPRSGFLYRDELAVPGHPYAAILMRTIQPGGPTQPNQAALLLDIDVFTLAPFPPDRTIIEQRLSDLHVLKNRIFFENVEPLALETCQ